MGWKELFFTGLYTGYSPVASGTAGTLLALLIYIIEFEIFASASNLINIFIVVIMLYPSIRLGTAGEKFFNKKDPSEIVLDEMMGYWISVLFFPFNWKIVLMAFILFRSIDILKPYPIRKFEKWKGGLGIMMDDFVSGIYTNIIIRIIILISGYFGIQVLR